MLSKVKVLALVVAGLAGTACSNNNEEVVVLDPRVDAMDVNGDLVVDRSEWNATLANWDVDHNGVITPSEFQFNAGGFRALDLNLDGLITDAEWQAGLDAWDLDDNLVLDESEF